MSTPCKSSPAATNTSTLRRLATASTSSSPELSGQSNVLAKAHAFGLQLDKGSPEVTAVLAEIKRLEKDGYEFEAAEASFELLVRRRLGLHQPLFTLQEYHCNYRRTGNRLYETCEATGEAAGRRSR